LATIIEIKGSLLELINIKIIAKITIKIIIDKQKHSLKL
jgi:hypothetical protein